MALVTEDGTGLPNADSYCSVVEAADYHTKRGNDAAWDAIDDQDAALRVATDYLTQMYSGQWRGVRATPTQALDWPRLNVLWPENEAKGYRPSSPLPNELKWAVAELALRVPDGLYVDEGRRVKQETIGPLTTVYEEGSSQQTSFVVVERWLRTLLDDDSYGYGSSRVYRA